MIELSKINQDWIPLQVKVFSRWVSSQLKNSKDVEVKDIQKDLSNGVALVELATELTHKPPTRGWVGKPKLKVEMVQNCELALDMFEKDGVNFVGISGKDISDNNQKLILGLIWTLILHYSVDQSVNNSNDLIPISNNIKHNPISNQQDKSDKKPINNKEVLMSWANHRVENYPNVHNFKPYDLSLCALLDSYFPQKINYYSLNPEDTEHNCALATKVMKEAGIPIYIYPEDLSKNNNTVDYKTLLTQLSSVKYVLDSVNSGEQSKQNNSDDNDDQNEINGKTEKYNSLLLQIESLEAALELQKSQLESALDKIQVQKTARIKIEEELKIEKELKSEAQSEVARVLRQIYKVEQENFIQKEVISKFENELDLLSNENSEKDEEIERLTRDLEKANSDIQELTETVKRQSVQESQETQNAEIERLSYALENSETYIETKENEQEDGQIALQFFNKAISDLQQDFDELYIQKANDEEEITRLRYALDMAQIEIENERNARQEDENELENIQSSQGETVSSKELDAEQQLRVQSLLSAIDEIEKSEAKAQSEVERLESEIESIHMKNKATTEAYSDAVEVALHEAEQEKEDREIAEKKVAQLTMKLEHRSNS